MPQGLMSCEVWMLAGFPGSFRFAGQGISKSGFGSRDLEVGIWNLKMLGAVTGAPNQLGYEDAGNRDIAVHRVQGAQLHNHQEQEDDHWPSRVREVLQALPLPQEAQRDQVVISGK